MRKTNKSALHFINEVAGKSRLYIIFLLLVQMVLGISSVFYALLLRGLIDGAVAHDSSKMLTYCILFAALVAGQIALRAVLRFLEEYAKATYENAFKSWLFAGLLTHNYGAVTATHSGEWMNRLTSDTVVVSEGLATIVPGVAGMVTKMAGALVVILIMEPRFAYILVPGGILLVLLTYIFRKQLKKLHKQMQEKDGLVRIFLQEHLGSLMIVKAFGKEADSLTEAENHMSEHKKARMRKNHFSNVCNIGFGAVMNGAYVLGAVYGAFGIYNGTMTYGTFMAMLQLISQIQNPFANITGYLPKYFAMLASAERLMEIEAYAKDELRDRDEGCVAGEVQTEHKAYMADTIDNGAEYSGSIDKSRKSRYIPDNSTFGLSHVDFTYLPPVVTEGDVIMPIVLNDYSLMIRKGEFVAFTGPSGCGKSTVLKLMMGLYTVDAGEVYGCDRSMFAYVPQGNQLMSGSIRDIITFSDKNRTEDEAGIRSALQIACADGFIAELEHGIDTLLGERGLGLSEGQMQRLAIARAIYSDRPVLLLDEATSALDAGTEEAVLENLRSMTDKTVIIVTHRPAALKLCDRQVAFGEEK
ncbi:ABC transporter ATP-binding protein [Mediterraneibacter sp. HCN-7094]